MDKRKRDGFLDWGIDGIIAGRNAVIEALDAKTPLDKIFIAKGETDGTLAHIASRAREMGCVVVDADKRKLETLAGQRAHQGIVAVCAVTNYVEIEDLLEIAQKKGESPFIIICDEITDPHNLGAIIRTAEGAGAHGVIIPKRRSAGIGPIVHKTSAGAVSHLPVARVANLPSTIRYLQKVGVWVYGTSSTAVKTLWETDFSGAIAIVIGSEGAGMRRLVSECCDFQVSIPMQGKISSLNASVSASLIMYEIVRQKTEIRMRSK